MKHIRLEKRDDGVGVLTLSRPEALNALNSATLRDLEEAAVLVEADGEIRCVVLTGEGKAFVAGADIAEMSGLSESEALEFATLGHAAMKRIDDLAVPTIAAINGYALGGGLELALCCDIRLASTRAKLGQPEVGLGITPGFGGTQRLPRTVGASEAMELILTARAIDAAEAERIGLVNRVYEPEALMQAALDMAAAIAANAPVAVRHSKAAVSRWTDSRLADDLAAEARLFSNCFTTNDRVMAMTAFLAKTKHEAFKGN